MHLLHGRHNEKAPHIIWLITDTKELAKTPLNEQEQKAAKTQFEGKNVVFQLLGAGKSLSVVLLKQEKERYIRIENARKNGHLLYRFLERTLAKEAQVTAAFNDEGLTAAFAEGALLSSYTFLKYKTENGKRHQVDRLVMDEKAVSGKLLKEVAIAAGANFEARNLINEPLSYLTAVQLSKEVQRMGKEAGFSVQVFDKKKIEQLKMGGLLAVNRGSQRPPTFSVLEWKPKNIRNKKPIVLVGKGIVFDTGGLSLKPTPNSMDMMKCDMSGAAAVAGIFYGAAKMNLPLHLIGLIPATDNRPGEDAYVPGDVVTMMSGLNVEVLNTDAEGRMILADALYYAQRFQPELVCDYATLTGAAARAIGSVATVYMGTAGETIKNALEESGYNTYERLVEFPLWEEYGQMIKSDVADIKNVGGADAGMITAGKFLERFTNYPWLHFDIAGPAYIMNEDHYRGKYATGVCVRLMLDFLKNYSPGTDAGRGKKS